MTDDPQATTAHWSELAACKGADLRRFFPDRPGLAAASTIRQFCVGCPVVADCDRDAEAHPKRPFGVWGARFHGGPGGQVWTLAELETTYTPRSSAPPPTRHGVCRWCLVSRQVRRDGSLRSHWVPAAGGGQTQCPGSGYLPREAS